MDSALRPRDIQARIRAGETPESVAQAAQTTVDRIMGFAMPVLAERAHIAERAQRSSVRRKASEGPARLLGDAVAERLRSRNVDPDSVEWDAWRRGDGRWTLVADYRSGESTRHAEFTFDAPGRYVVADDDEAKWLVGEQTAAKDPQPKSTSASGRRLSVVADEELPLGEDAIGMVTGDADWMATQATERAEPAPEAPQRVDREGPEGPDGTERTGLAGHTEETGDNEPTVALADVSQPDAGASPSVVAPEADNPADDQGERGDQGERRDAPAHRSTQTPAASASDEPEDAGQEERPQERRPAKKSARKGRRASVPSWDEIMFGGGRSE